MAARSAPSSSRATQRSVKVVRGAAAVAVERSSVCQLSVFYFTVVF